jgi:biotin operon repressor
MRRLFSFELGMVICTRILTLLRHEHSYRAVARMVGCSHRNVASATRVIQEHGVTLERLRS